MDESANLALGPVGRSGCRVRYRQLTDAALDMAVSAAALDLIVQPPKEAVDRAPQWGSHQMIQDDLPASDLQCSYVDHPPS